MEHCKHGESGQRYQFLRSPWESQFDSLLSGAKEYLALCAPYMTAAGTKKLVQRAAVWPKEFSLMLLTNLSRDNMISGSTDVAAIASLARAFPGLQVRFLPSLHAKVYLSESEAIVTSANMTQSGFSANFEYGVRFTDTRTLQRVRQDVMEYAALASPVDAERLAILEEATEHVRRLSTKAQASLKRALRREFEQKVREIDDEVLRIRTAGRAAHAIFADAILYVLRRGPASTAEIHQAIRHIHPDLCDDTEDRVIDGRHFGKKWKHAVRTAQQYLKRQGLVELADRTWRLI